MLIYTDDPRNNKVKVKPKAKPKKPKPKAIGIAIPKNATKDNKTKKKGKAGGAKVTNVKKSAVAAAISIPPAVIQSSSSSATQLQQHQIPRKPVTVPSSPPPPYQETVPLTRPRSPPPPFSGAQTHFLQPPPAPEIPRLRFNNRANPTVTPTPPTPTPLLRPAAAQCRPNLIPNKHSKNKSTSSADLLSGRLPLAASPRLRDDGINGESWGAGSLGAGVVDGRARERISAKFDDVLTLIDHGQFSGGEEELAITQTIVGTEPVLRGGWGFPSKVGASQAVNSGVTKAVSSRKSINVFAKVNLYANSRLPADLPPLKLYLPSYPLICLAAQFSERAYEKPAHLERETHVSASWRTGTKAMVIKSVPVDHMSAIVFAIRGTQTFMDWAVNLATSPTPPTNFLLDNGNLCHAGFLSVARKMVKPVAARLRSLLEEDPSRAARCSLVMTGHSAGGAVAALLFAHMLDGSLEPHQMPPGFSSVSSELSTLAGYFKRIHCITFGAPPVSLLPLSKPPAAWGRCFQKSLFLSFINEGDPVPRADKRYVKYLLDLYLSPAPKSFSASSSPDDGPENKPCPLLGGGGVTLPSFNLSLPFRPKQQQQQQQQTPSPATAPAAVRRHSDPSTSTTQNKKPTWPVPPGTLSIAGRAVVLREGAKVTAGVASDQTLRGVVFGDPMMHVMALYRRRVECLAMDKVISY